MSDIYYASALPKANMSDHEIATTLDAQFCLFRIGHAGRGSDDEYVILMSKRIGAHIGALDG